TTSDSNILRRRWLLIDVDPSRPAGVSSSDEEKKRAEHKAEEIRTYLRSLEWPEPLMADSGNGYHLLYRVDLPNDDPCKALITQCLDALATRFDDDFVKVDRSVFNASRIVKAYGSKAAKGDNTKERPHRLSRLLSGELPPGGIVSEEKLA